MSDKKPPSIDTHRLAQARHIMVELATSKGLKIEDVATKWFEASNTLVEAKVRSDGSDVREPGVFDYKKQAENVMKAIDKLTKANDEKSASKASEELSNQMYQGTRYTVGLERHQPKAR